MKKWFIATSVVTLGLCLSFFCTEANVAFTRWRLSAAEKYEWRDTCRKCGRTVNITDSDGQGICPECCNHPKKYWDPLIKQWQCSECGLDLGKNDPPWYAKPGAGAHWTFGDEEVPPPDDPFKDEVPPAPKKIGVQRPISEEERHRFWNARNREMIESMWRQAYLAAIGHGESSEVCKRYADQYVIDFERFQRERFK